MHESDTAARDHIQVNGTAQGEFTRVRDALERRLRTGEEVGAAVAVMIDGHLVADLWGGHLDAARSIPWTKDSIVNVWSNTKTVLAVGFMSLVERGLIDLDSPVARYWPEFAANGKSGVRVRDVLAHASGVSGLDHPATVHDLYDVPTAVARMAEQAPWWEPGSASGYHLFNYGHLLGELIRRVTGQDLREFIRDDVAAPLGADFQIGVAEGDWHRTASIITPPPLPFDLEDLDHSSVGYKTFTGPAVNAEAANSPEWRAAQIGGANGHGNARSLAQILSVLAEGGSSRGVRLFDAARAGQMLTAQTDGTDLVNGLTVRWGLGLAVSDHRTLTWIPEGDIGYWGGWGGSMGIVDRDRRMVVTYVMNKMGGEILGSDRARDYVEAVYAAVTGFESRV